MQARSSAWYGRAGRPSLGIRFPLYSVAHQLRRYGVVVDLLDRAVVGLDRVSDPAARAVEQDPLVPGRNLERLTDLLRAPALDVPQRDHRPLRLGQLGDRSGDHLAGLAG